MFFIQENMPIIDINGKLILSEIYKVNLASNGNENVFKALKKSKEIMANKINEILKRELS